MPRNYRNGRSACDASFCPDAEPLYTWAPKAGVCGIPPGQPNEGASLTAVTYRTPDKEQCSSSYMDQTVSVDVSPRGSVSSNLFTVVKLDVTVGGLAEADEETAGAFVPYEADTNGTLTVKGTLALKMVLFQCVPDDLPDSETVTVAAPEGHLYEKIGGSYYEFPSGSYTVGELNRIILWLHGHAASGSSRDREIEITHANSGAKDKAKFTVVQADLEASKNMLTLKHDRDCNLEIKTMPATGIAVDEYRIDIKRVSGTTWYVLGASKTMTPWHANIAGAFHLRGMAKIGGTECYSENIVIESQFPTYAQIAGDSGVRTATDTEWVNTLNDCTDNPNLRRERGFWIQLNTIDNLYRHTAVFTGSWAGPTEGASATPGKTPADIPADPAPNATGAIYTVALFHTHTPTTYKPVGRGVGPSGPRKGDIPFHNSRQRVGIVYDYTGDARGRIPAGHPEGAAAQRYPVGPIRRPLP